MALALKLYRADMRNPTFEREALQTLSANELSEQLKQRSLSSIVTKNPPQSPGAPAGRDL